MSRAEDPQIVLQVRDLCVGTDDAAGALRLLDGVSFEVREGEVLCIVGESGSGKSLSMLACMGMLPAGTAVLSGSIALKGRDVLRMHDAERRALRGATVSMVFQDPMSALNPLMRVGRQIEETLALHRPDLDRRARCRQVEALLAAVHIPNPALRAGSYPHQLSGGMRQRVLIAMAMAHAPSLLIADEPTTALDVTVQAQILGLFAEMRRDSRMGQVLITHDLGVVAQTADRVAVLYCGRIVETADVHALFRAPAHPYTVGLLASLLHPGQTRAQAISGQPPLAAERPPGCAFRPRCAIGRDREVCAQHVPPFVTVGPGHETACLFPDEVRALSASVP